MRTLFGLCALMFVIMMGLDISACRSYYVETQRSHRLNECLAMEAPARDQSPSVLKACEEYAGLTLKQP